MRKLFLGMSIATRLGLGFGALVFLILTFSLLVLYQMVDLKEQSDTLYHHPFTVSRTVDAIEIEILKIHREMNGTYLGGSIFNVGWIKHAVCAVIHRTCRQALIKKGLVLLRNAWWIAQKTLIHPTIRLK